MYMYPPASAETLASLGIGPMIPQPYIYDQQTGELVSYWNSQETLGAGCRQLRFSIRSRRDLYLDSGLRSQRRR